MPAASILQGHSSSHQALIEGCGLLAVICMPAEEIALKQSSSAFAYLTLPTPASPHPARQA
jgi:hypothetical protein